MKIKITNLMDRETKAIIKISTLGVLGGALSLLTFYFFNQLLITLNFTMGWFMLGSLLLFLTVFALQVFFVDDFSILVIFSLVQATLATMVFIPYHDGSKASLYFLLGGFAILALFLTIGAKNGFTALENSMEIKYFSIVHSTIPKVLAGLLIFLAIISYFYFFHAGNFSDDVGEILFSKALESIEPAFQVWFPGVMFDMTVDEALDVMGETQLKRSRIDLLQQGIRIEDLPPDVQSNLLNQVRGQLRQSLESIGGPAQLDETMRNYFFRAVSGWVDGVTEDARLLVQAGSIILIYLLLKSISFALYLPAELLAFLIAKLLLLLNFADIVLKDETKEVIRV